MKVLLSLVLDSSKANVSFAVNRSPNSCDKSMLRFKTAKLASYPCFRFIGCPPMLTEGLQTVSIQKTCQILSFTMKHSIPTLPASWSVKFSTYRGNVAARLSSNHVIHFHLNAILRNSTSRFIGT